MLRLHVVTPLPCPQWDMSQPGSRTVPPQTRKVSYCFSFIWIFRSISSIKPPLMMLLFVWSCWMSVGIIKDAFPLKPAANLESALHEWSAAPNRCLNVDVHHTHDQKQWLKLCDRVNFQAKFPAERGTERCEEKMPVEKKSKWIWQTCARACALAEPNASVSQKQMSRSCCERMQIFIHVRVPTGVDLEHSTGWTLRKGTESFIPLPRIWASYFPGIYTSNWTEDALIVIVSPLYRTPVPNSCFFRAAVALVQ